MSSHPNPLPTPMLVLFGLVNLPLSMLMSPTAAILPNFYLEYSAVTLAGLATATFIARSFDGLTDPLIGYLSDRTGTRKPWMILGAVVVAASTWFLFNPAADAGLGHLLTWYLLTTLGWTLVEIPHTAMAAELSSGYHERSRIALWRQLLGFAGGILFMAAPMLLVGGTTRFGPEVMRVLAVFIMAGLPLSVALMCLTVPEPVRRVRARPVRPVDLWHALRDTPPLRYFLVTQVLFGLATGAVASLFVIYASQHLGLPDKVPQIALPMTLAMALGMPLWLQVMKHVDKHRAWAIAAGGMIATLLMVPWIAPGPGALLPMIGVMTSFGFFLGLSSIALPSLLADIVDYDIWRNRQNRAAILFSFQALVTKLNQGLGGAIALSIPALFGFSGQAAPSAHGVLGLKLAFVAWPCVLLALMLALAWRYPLDRRAHGILARRIGRRSPGRALGTADAGSVETP
ncbi:MFS transporter [Wenzhouxiangella sp. XN24]|uniref:MFS transporter n=1 Tax=Wenzhouxiangella sp. XN24 TaxID=2713569 RepID=UPI0013EBFD50|nr:MFS transporter [Wenzhouxiangella sp. XN24]NGX17406.1 MFS transporter [Wenzhouxiangella sp. XN24]